MRELRLSLPWGGSANAYWRSLRAGPMAGRVLLSKQAREYRERVQGIARDLGLDDLKLAGSLGVSINAFPPNRIRRDIDNLVKPLLDAIMHAGIIEDDFFIDELTIKRCRVVKEGWIEITIRQLDEPSELELPLTG